MHCSANAAVRSAAARRGTPPPDGATDHTLLKYGISLNIKYPYLLEIYVV
jgi:hypothetical protein